MGTNIDDNLAVFATCVSNVFLDKYMACANGDYIKVYLYLLRHKGESFGVKDVADELNLTDNDIERAVRYWESEGVFSKGSSDAVMEEINAEVRASEAEELLDERMLGFKTGVDTEDSLRDLQHDEEFAGILFVAKHVLPNLPTAKQVYTLKYMYTELKMKSDIIEFMLEYCAGLGKTSSRYLQAVAINWHEQGISTVKQAKNMIKEFEQKKTAPKKKTVNKFINFESSDTDYESLVRSKVMDRIRNGVK